MFADERLTAETSQTEEFSTEPAALARARELIEDSHYHAISFSGNSERPVHDNLPGFTRLHSGRRATEG
jgi:hypothetical protein